MTLQPRRSDIYVNGVLDNGVLLGGVPSSQSLPEPECHHGKPQRRLLLSRARSTISGFTAGPCSAEEVHRRYEYPRNNNLLSSSVRPLPCPRQPRGEPSWHHHQPQTPGGRPVAQCSCRRSPAAPRNIDAGIQTTCELRLAASAASQQIRVSSTSDQVRVPAVVPLAPINPV